MNDTYITVSQLNRYIKILLSDNPKLRGVYIKGEISNFNRNYRSGHCYLSLKDTDASVKAVMFKSVADRIKFDIEDGMSVVVRADVSLYERDGTFQLVLSDMIPYGIGELSLAFEQLKTKLAEKGMFDDSFKKPIPQFPRRIAIISSKTGAAIQDIFNILKRRMPYVDVDLYPVSVQGENTAPEVVKALKYIEEKNNVDEIIIARGGGSKEDLHQFNNEALAYAIFDCKIPIISAIGHEIDFTICDFVADLRAPTPSAAAELAGVSVSEISERANALQKLVDISLRKRISANKYTIQSVYIPRITEKLNETVRKNRQKTDFLIKYSEKSVNNKISSLSLKFKGDCARLEALNPFSVLKRGYAIVRDSSAKHIVSVKQATTGDNINVKLKDGSITATITGVQSDA